MCLGSYHGYRTFMLHIYDFLMVFGSSLKIKQIENGKLLRLLISFWLPIFNVIDQWPLLIPILSPFPFQHMIKYRYIPFTHGKPKYRRIDTPQVQQQWQLKAQASPAVAPLTTTTANNNESIAAPVAATAMPPPPVVKTYSSGSFVPELSSSGGSGSNAASIQILWQRSLATSIPYYL